MISLAVLLGGSILRAQDNAETPLTIGGFNTQGSVTVGYRFDDVKGYVPMFQDLTGLEKGVRLLDFNLFGDAAKGANPFADSYSLSVSGLGGEPFEAGQFTVRKNRLYDFRANWRQSYFYSNENDNVILPIAAVGPGLSKGLTDNHDWGTVRKFGSADLTLHASNNLRFNFDYYRTSDSGPTFTTESLDFFDSPIGVPLRAPTLITFTRPSTIIPTALPGASITRTAPGPFITTWATRRSRKM